jgi:outer membrane lipoprotein-sorting protein
MNEDKTVNSLEDQLRAALGPRPTPNFDAWQARHADAIAHLNPVVTALKQRQQRLLVGLANATVAAGVCGFLVWIFAGQQNSLAQAIKAIDNAQTITWTATIYERLTSVDGKRTWLRTTKLACAYRSPGLYRIARYDSTGNISEVEITDSKINKTLRLEMKSKKAVLTTPRVYRDPKGPFSLSALKTKSLEWVGKRSWKDKTVNVFRIRREQMKTRNSYDIWIDPNTKQLVGILDPGADYFDPTTEADRENPNEEKSSMGKMLGSVVDDIVFDAKLDAALFSLDPPSGFEFVQEPPHPKVSESEMIEFLAANARFNDGTFPDTARGIDNERFNAAYAKKPTDRTEAEQKLIDLTYKHMLDQNSIPIWDFAEDNTVTGSFRYVGKGVKLGSPDRIVCWYKLRGTGTWRAVFADLTVKDVAPTDLPLPVEQ